MVTVILSSIVSFLLLFQFLLRLHLFNETSSKYRQELGEKTRKVVSEIR